MTLALVDAFDDFPACFGRMPSVLEDRANLQAARMFDWSAMGSVLNQRRLLAALDPSMDLPIPLQERENHVQFQARLVTHFAFLRETGGLVWPKK